jgi:hypothetical protein
VPTEETLTAQPFHYAAFKTFWQWLTVLPHSGKPLPKLGRE